MKLFFNCSLFFFCALLILSSTHLSYAQTTTATTTNTEVATSTAPIIAPAPTPTEKGTVLKKRTQERVRNLAANISNRLDAIIARLENISARLNTRIEKLNQTGTDTSAAAASLDKARTALSAAKEQMKGIDGAVATALGSRDPKTQWQSIRIKFITTRDNIRTAHTELKNTIVNLKSAPPAAPVEQTATSSNESQ